MRRAFKNRTSKHQAMPSVFKPDMKYRERIRTGLHEVYVPFYDILCGLLPFTWQPISGFRSFEEQAGLYSRGRTQPGPIVTNSKPGLSFHNWGLATDWAYFENGKKYIDLEYENPIWEEYIAACNKAGVKCLEWERPHNQLDIIYSAQDLLGVYTKDGLMAVHALIKGVN